MIREDVEFGLNIATSDQRQATGEVSVGAVPLAAAGAPNPFGESANPKLTAYKSREAATSNEARFGSGKIFAVELRKVTTEPFHRKEPRLKSDGLGNIDSSRLARKDLDEDGEDDLNKPIDPEDFISMGLPMKNMYFVNMFTPTALGAWPEEND